MDTKILIALIGVGGTLVGALSTLLGQSLLHLLQERTKRRFDVPRKKLLVEMLHHPKYAWRNLDTLTHVIGADEETTKRLLLELGARASEDGQPLWGLVERNPFPDKQ